MSSVRKISIRKIIQTLFTIVLVVVCVLAMMSASKIQATKKLKGLNIKIENEEYCQFVNQQQIQNALLKKRHLKVNQLELGNLDLKKMESILMTNPWIETAQIFVDNQKNLNVEVIQRRPLLRIFDRIGNTYYIDSSLKILPISEAYTHYELIFVNVPIIKDDSIGTSVKQRMADIAKELKSDSFWLAQTSEIVVNNLNDIQLIPVMGKHKILLGDAKDLEKKLDNIFAFYQNVLSKIGWDWYEIIDARFDHQVVASPSLPWKAPIDRALTNMNWVKTIIGDLPLDETLNRAQ